MEKEFNLYQIKKTTVTTKVTTIIGLAESKEAAEKGEWNNAYEANSYVDRNGMCRETGTNTQITNIKETTIVEAVTE